MGQTKLDRLVRWDCIARKCPFVCIFDSESNSGTFYRQYLREFLAGVSSAQVRFDTSNHNLISPRGCIYPNCKRSTYIEALCWQALLAMKTYTVVLHLDRLLLMHLVQSGRRQSPKASLDALDQRKGLAIIDFYSLEAYLQTCRTSSCSSIISWLLTKNSETADDHNFMVQVRLCLGPFQILMFKNWASANWFNKSDRQWQWILQMSTDKSPLIRNSYLASNNSQLFIRLTFFRDKLVQRRLNFLFRLLFAVKKFQRGTLS